MRGDGRREVKRGEERGTKEGTKYSQILVELIQH